jgi:hypothetical protein
MKSRIAAAIIATASIALLLAACSGSSSSAGSGGSPNAGGSGSSPSAVSYSSCIRSHGVPNFPDPPSSGQVPKGDAQHFGVSNSMFRAAQTACQHLYPPSLGSIEECESTGICPQAVVQQALTIMRRYAQCIRAHGVPKWPDPTIDSEGRPFFNASGAGITYQFTHSAFMASKDRVCERQVGGSAGVPVPVG